MNPFLIIFLLFPAVGKTLHLKLRCSNAHSWWSCLGRLRRSVCGLRHHCSNQRSPSRCCRVQRVLENGWCHWHRRWHWRWQWHRCEHGCSNRRSSWHGRGHRLRCSGGHRCCSRLRRRHGLREGGRLGKRLSWRHSHCNRRRGCGHGHRRGGWHGSRKSLLRERRGSTSGRSRRWIRSGRRHVCRWEHLWGHQRRHGGRGGRRQRRAPHRHRTHRYAHVHPRKPGGGGTAGGHGGSCDGGSDGHGAPDVDFPVRVFVVLAAAQAPQGAQSAAQHFAALAASVGHALVGDAVDAALGATRLLAAAAT